MSYRHLCVRYKTLQTLFMRLPQSSSEPLSIRPVFLVFFLFSVAMLPLHARSGQQLYSSPANIRFGSVLVGQAESQSVTLTNSGTSSVTISAITPKGSGVSVSGLNLPAIVAAGQSVSLTITFAPTSTGWVGNEITVTSTASNSNLQIGFHANGVGTDPMTAAPSSLSFGQVSVGSSSALSVALTNVGSGVETLTAFQTTGSGFSVSGPNLPLVLNQGQSVTLSVTFAPQSSGTLTGSIFVPGPGLSIPLNGTGATIGGQLTVSPTSMSFGSVDLGSTTTQATTISATGGSVTVSSASSSSSQFSISGLTLPLTLNAGQSALVNVVFAPSASGSASATLTFTTSTSAKDTESLSGTGVSPQYSVSLSWIPSTSTVSGYNVYRGTAVGSYTKINSSLDPSTTYTDNTVAAGATYYYAATSVNSSGQESSYSSPLQVSVP